jgi:hypothetical protein
MRPAKISAGRATLCGATHEPDSADIEREELWGGDLRRRFFLLTEKVIYPTHFQSIAVRELSAGKMPTGPTAKMAATAGGGFKIGTSSKGLAALNLARNNTNK